MNERTDSVLLREYVENRSEGAFAELVWKHIDFVYSSAVRMVVDPHLAEDVTQATFAALAGDGRRQQLLIARKDYDIRLHELFPDQRYDRYREYELSRKSSGEVSRFRAFLEQQHLTLDSASEVTIARLIRELRTYTQHSWHGPFDGLPQVAVGNDEVVAQLESRTEDLARNGSALLNRAANLGISDSLLTALNDYFSAHINENRARSEQIRRKASTPGGNK